MATDDKTYTYPADTEPAMACEDVATYTAQQSHEQIILTVPHGMDAEPLRKKVNAYYDAILHDYTVEQKFRKTLDNWLFCTAMYSGPNLCWDNEPFRQIESMGRTALSMIEKVMDSYPDSSHRHLGWLRRKLQS